MQGTTTEQNWNLVFVFMTLNNKNGLNSSNLRKTAKNCQNCRNLSKYK
jgi:hypothetical protein